MRFLAVACDYDGTIAHHGRVSAKTVAALERLKASGRKLLLVTGRQLEELFGIFPEVELFDVIVAENGPVVYAPASGDELVLAPPPPASFVETLRARGVQPLSTGRVVVATWRPHERTVLEVICEQELELQVIFNKGAVMVLPSGVNKGTGLLAGLRALELSPRNCVGFGDAENDHAFLSMCECSVAVANALGSLKASVDVVTNADHGDGVAELAEELLENELENRQALRRHDVPLGARADGSVVTLPVYGQSVLLTGLSGAGKSTATTAILERLSQRGYQWCLVDPEGDHEHTGGAVTVGGSDHAPDLVEALQLLENPEQRVVVNIMGVPLAERPRIFAKLFLQLLDMRARTGRPHWIVVEEAHHMLPEKWQPAPLVMPKHLKQMIYVTIHSQHLSRDVVSQLDVVVSVGKGAEESMRELAATISRTVVLSDRTAEFGEGLVWKLAEEQPELVTLARPRGEHLRHRRKYAAGELGPDLSFYFRGPAGKLKLRAHNLHMFTILADGVDDETWLHHLYAGDYAEWFQRAIKDDALATQAREIQKSGMPASESRLLIRRAIEQRYTGPI